MAIKVNTGLTPEWYTLEDQKGEDVPARFYVKPMDQMSFYEFCSATDFKDGNFNPSPDAVKMLLHKCVLNWEGFEDQDGKPLKFSRINWAYIPAQYIREIASYVFGISAMSEEDKKN